MACDVTAVVKGEHLPLIRSEYLRRTERHAALPAAQRRWRPGGRTAFVTGPASLIRRDKVSVPRAAAGHIT
jgi:hypothetical protein